MHFLRNKLTSFFLFFSFCLLSGCAYFSLPATPTPAKSSFTLADAKGYQDLPTSTATHIALLLPLQGPLAKQGEAIRNGFLASYYYDKQQQPDHVPTVTVVDTSSGNIVNLYQQAVNNGANLIVGPLAKPEVAALAQLGKLPVPTLALNTLTNVNAIPNLFQFGLSPLEEAERVAIHARQAGYNRALIIAPAGAWGQSIAQAFVQRFQQEGGTIMGSFAFSDPSGFSNGVRNLLQFSQRKISDKPNARPVLARRQDVDMVFMAAFPQQARLLRPMLLYYNASDLPVYATSLVYGGVPTPQYDNDLNGIVFCDMPWILNNNLSPNLNDIRSRIQTLWADSYKHSARLYAMGVDAYTLATHMDGLNSGIDGATGNLYINASGRILRHLTWAKMVDGSPQLQP